MNIGNVLNRAGRIALVAAVLGATGAGPASAQTSAPDSAAVLLAAAEEFDERGEAEVAEALLRHIVDQFPGTPAADAARVRLEAATAERSQAGGETELKVWSTLYGIWLGFAVPAAFDADGPEPYGVGLLLGGPAGFFGGRAYARRRPVSLGQARAITWGGTWGSYQGLVLANALDDQPQPEVVFTSMIAGGTVGLAGGMLLARNEISSGTSTAAMLGSVFGNWVGVASAVLLDLDENPTWAAMMVGGNAGLLGGTLAGRHWQLSRSRVRLIGIGTVIGGVAGGGIILIADAQRDEAIAVPLAGSIVGLAVGAALTRGHDAEEDASGDADAAPSPAAQGALFNWSGGDWSVSAPLPTPAVQPGARADGSDALVWRVPLLGLRF